MLGQISAHSQPIEQVAPRATVYTLDIFVPDHSQGLLVDALVLQQVLGSDKVRILAIPPQAYRNETTDDGNAFDFEPLAAIALFVEGLFEHSKLDAYKKRIFLPNPEWLTSNDENIARKIVHEFWHKTHFGMGLLTKVFPGKIHKYTGFTSMCIPSAVNNYFSFAHLPGKSKTRHTQDIIDIWLKDTNLPTLTFQVYGVGLRLPKWISHDNLRFYIGYLDDKNMNSEYSKHGIHICTSQMEGFGHYINQARAVGALIITIDAPPMNELIDSSCGILVPPTQRLFHNHGVKFVASQEVIKEGIYRAMQMSIQDRKKLGTKARERFIKEKEEFGNRLNSILLN